MEVDRKSSISVRDTFPRIHILARGMCWNIKLSKARVGVQGVMGAWRVSPLEQEL